MSRKLPKLIGAATALSLLVSSLTGCGSSVGTLSKGDCLDLRADATSQGVFDPEKLNTVSCSKAHNAEVVDILRLGEGQYPGAEALTKKVETFCPTAFTLYIGKSPRDSLLDLLPLAPTEESWTKGKDRLIVCLAYSQHEKIARSFKNTQR